MLGALPLFPKFSVMRWLYRRRDGSLSIFLPPASGRTAWIASAHDLTGCSCSLTLRNSYRAWNDCLVCLYAAWRILIPDSPRHGSLERGTRATLHGPFSWGHHNKLIWFFKFIGLAVLQIEASDVQKWINISSSNKRWAGFPRCLYFTGT